MKRKKMSDKVIFFCMASVKNIYVPIFLTLHEKLLQIPLNTCRIFFSVHVEICWFNGRRHVLFAYNSYKKKNGKTEKN